MCRRQAFVVRVIHSIAHSLQVFSSCFNIRQKAWLYCNINFLAPLKKNHSMWEQQGKRGLFLEKVSPKLPNPPCPSEDITPPPCYAKDSILHPCSAEDVPLHLCHNEVTTWVTTLPWGPWVSILHLLCHHITWQCSSIHLTRYMKNFATLLALQRMLLLWPL